VRYPGGVRVDIEVHGDQVRGLPTTFDYDYFLALCRIADEGGVDSQGYFVDPGYRAVLRAAGRSDDAIGGEQVEAVKRAFARFGGLILYTKLDVDYSHTSAQVRSGARHPLVPDGAPPVREREGKHWVLEYDVEAERRRNASYNSIERLRINPLWLDQAAAGIAATVNHRLGVMLALSQRPDIHRRERAISVLKLRPQPHRRLGHGERRVEDERSIVDAGQRGHARMQSRGELLNRR
jgi:hypothetical protein